MTDETMLIPADYMTHGLEMIAEAIADKLDEGWLLTDDAGVDPYSTDVFTMRSGTTGLPNFSYSGEDGLTLDVYWNGDARHGIVSNRYLSKQEWNKVVSTCMEFLDAEW